MGRKRTFCNKIQNEIQTMRKHILILAVLYTSQQAESATLTCTLPSKGSDQYVANYDADYFLNTDRWFIWTSFTPPPPTTVPLTWANGTPVTTTTPMPKLVPVVSMLHDTQTGSNGTDCEKTYTHDSFGNTYPISTGIVTAATCDAVDNPTGVAQTTIQTQGTGGAWSGMYLRAIASSALYVANGTSKPTETTFTIETNDLACCTASGTFSMPTQSRYIIQKNTTEMATGTPPISLSGTISCVRAPIQFIASVNRRDITVSVQRGKIATESVIVAGTADGYPVSEWSVTPVLTLDDASGEVVAVTLYDNNNGSIIHSGETRSYTGNVYYDIIVEGREAGQTTGTLNLNAEIP